MHVHHQHDHSSAGSQVCLEVVLEVLNALPSLMSVPSFSRTLGATGMDVKWEVSPETISLFDPNHHDHKHRFRFWLPHPWQKRAPLDPVVCQVLRREEVEGVEFRRKQKKYTLTHVAWKWMAPLVGRGKGCPSSKEIPLSSSNTMGFFSAPATEGTACRREGSDHW